MKGTQFRGWIVEKTPIIQMQHVVEEETALIQFLHDISTHHLTDINIASSKHKVY